MNKKGDIELSLSVIFRLILVVLVAGVLFYNTYKIYKTDFYTLKALNIDLSLNVDALHALSSDESAFAAFNFPFEVDVLIEGKGNKIKLTRDKLHSEYFFTGDPVVKTQSTDLKNVKTLYLIKDGKSLLFSKFTPKLQNLYTCPKLNLNLKEVMIDPDKSTLDIAAMLSAYFDKPKFYTANTVASVKDKRAEVKDALISLKSTNNEVIKVYINPKKESAALACNILNKLNSKFDFENKAVIPVNFNLIKDDDYKQLLNLEKTAVLIELNENFIYKKKDVAEAISEGVKDA